jgi:hypothetical protein
LRGADFFLGLRPCFFDDHRRGCSGFGPAALDVFDQPRIDLPWALSTLDAVRRHDPSTRVPSTLEAI